MPRMKIEKNSNIKLIKWIYVIPLISIVLLVIVIAAIFILKEKSIYQKDFNSYKAKLLKIKKLETQDRILKLVSQIESNEKILLQTSKENVKNLVDFAYKIIDGIYKQNRDKDKKYIVNIIKDRLRDMRFFDNLSGYFYMYYLDGTCILLPTNPQYEGKNLINVKDAKGTKIIKKAIEILKTKDMAFESWYWYKPGEKVMKKKIGYFRVYKPLNIYVGSAFYVEDVIKKAKKIALDIIRSYHYGDKGYIFAYDYKGNTLNHINKNIIGKNRINIVLGNRHILKEMIVGAKLNKEGFFISYIASYDPATHKQARKISFIKAIPEFRWIVGTGIYISDLRNSVLKKYNLLQKELDRNIQNIILLSLIMIAILGFVMSIIARKIKNIIEIYEDDLLKQYNKIISQKRVFQLLFEKSKDGIFLGNEKKFLDCNEVAVSMFGAKSKDELLKQNALTLSPKTQPDGKSSKEKISYIFAVAKKEGVYRGEWLAKKLDGSIFWLEMAVTSIDFDDKIVFHTVFKDINQRKKIEKELKKNEAKLIYRARHDALTKLPNRFMFSEVITHEILKAKREDKKVALLFLDFDGFKYINDFYGHDMGDELLVKASQRLKEEVRESDYLFRFGGDEFVLLFSDFNSENDIAKIAQKLINTFSSPFFIGGHLLQIGISIGIAIYPDDGITSDELLRNADIAMYKAKEKGKGSYVFFEEKMYEKIIQRHLLEEDIKKAIENDEFIVYYQPQVDIKNHKIIGLEALVRWQKDGKIVAPGEFIEVASSCNLIGDIGRIVIKKSIQFVLQLKEKYPYLEKISINLDDKQLKSGNIVNIIKNYLKVYNCNPKLIEFEVTEGFIMEDVYGSYKLLREIKDLGCSISIDDFGTGYSSLAYIKRLPFDVIKIDQSFIKDIPGMPEDEAIVNTIIELGKGLRLTIIAEGIENKEQEDFLKRRGCNIIQGYLYSKPLPEKDIITFIKNF